jgi:hypothetical protein
MYNKSLPSKQKNQLVYSQKFTTPKMTPKMTPKNKRNNSKPYTTTISFIQTITLRFWFNNSAIW